jgi:hypothetical protein
MMLASHLAQEKAKVMAVLSDPTMVQTMVDL